MTITRLDAVSIFNDKLTFLIPHEWTEVKSDENNTYQYQSPDATSGVLPSLINHWAWPSAETKEEFPERTRQC